MINLCVPAIIYVIFSITQIIIDTYKGLYNTAIIKTIIMFMITTLLQILCDRGLNVVSWIIVFVPFILMTVIVSIILYVFGLKASTGLIDSTNNKTNNSNNDSTACDKNVYKDSEGNIVIFHPYYDAKKNPVYYDLPNIIVPNPELFSHNKHDCDSAQNRRLPVPPNYSSSPMFQ
jgi:hypothetical protein